MKNDSRDDIASKNKNGKDGHEDTHEEICHRGTEARREEGLPVGWNKVLITQVAKIIGGATPNANDPAMFCEEGGIAWLTPADLSGYEEKYITRGKRNLTQLGYESCSTRLMPKGSVLFSSRAPIGYLAISSNPICTNQGFKSFECGSVINNEYLYYYLKSSKEYLESIATGSTFKELSATRIADLTLPLPPLPEQKRIAARLDLLLGRLKAARARLDAVPELVARFRKSVLAMAVSGRLTEEWRAEHAAELPSAEELLARVRAERRAAWEKAELEKLRAKGKDPKDDGWKQKYVEPEPVDASELGELPEGWVWVVTSSVCSSVFDGTHDAPKYYDHGFPLVTSKNIINHQIDLEDTKKILEKDHREISKRSGLKIGDLLYSMIGTVGNTAIVRTTTEFSIKNIGVFRCTLVSSKYLELYLNSPIHLSWLSESIQGTSQKFAGLDLLRNIPVMMPEIAEQSEIVRRVDELFSMADALEARVAEARAMAERLEPSILAKAFRGELSEQVPEEAAAWEATLAELEREAAALGEKAAPKRGRKAKASAAPEPVAAKAPAKRGRKLKEQAQLAAETESIYGGEKKKRGRPRKAESAEPGAKRGPGRPRKAESATPVASKRGRGRPRKERP